MLKITETEIRQWADKHQCRSSLPVLVRRLISETTDGIESIRFPGNEAVDLVGLDGELTTANGSVWVPRGKSFWEVGCNQDPTVKANSDYQKRLEEVEAEVRESAAFVFVTPRRWPGKDDWVEERKLEKAWSDVRAFDAIDLETWLEETTATTRWMSELLGNNQSGLITPEEWWRRWSTASTPPLSMKLVASRRGDQASKLLEQLRSDAATIAIAGDDHSEAAAFVISAMEEAGATDLLDRTIVATKGGETLPHSERSRLIVVCDLPEGEDINIPDRRGTTLVRTYPKGRLDVKEPLELSHVPSTAFTTGLQAMGVSEESARRLALETGHSITVLRRRLSSDPEVRRPVWARDREEVTRLLPFALVGAWSHRDTYSDITALALLGDTTEEAIVEAQIRLMELEDAPLVRYGSNSLIVSRIDALFALGPQLNATDLDRFFELAPALISERDPALDLPRDKWWMANVLGKSRAYSGGLLSGVGDTLCMLAIYGNSICGTRLRIDIEAMVERVVRGLLTEVSEEGWLTLRSQLRMLAEASPIAFLDCIETELRKSDPSIKSIMGVAEGGMSGDCLRTDLLWALEALAWHPEHFRRAATVLFELRRFDGLMDDNWSNKPSEAANQIFRAFPPCSMLDVRSKMDVLSDLAQSHRSAVLDQLLALVPDRHGGIVFHKSRPRWRDPEGETPVIYNTDAVYVAKSASRQIMDLAPLDFSEFEKVLPAADRLLKVDIERLVADVERWGNETKDDAQKGKLRHILRKEATSRAYQRRAKTDDWLEPAFERMEVATEPQGAAHRYKWMFEQDHIEWSRLVRAEEDESLSWQEREERVRGVRLTALEEISAEDGEESLLQFAIASDHPYIVADVLVRTETSVDDTVKWASRALKHDNLEASKQFLRAVFWNKRTDDLQKIVSKLTNKLPETKTRKRIAVCLPGERFGWEAAASLGKEAEEAFWGSTMIRIWRDTPDADAEFAAERLLAAERPRSAFAAFAHSEEKLPNRVWKKILPAIAAGGEPDGPCPQTYSLGRIFSSFDDDAEIGGDEIARLELPFVSLMCHHGFRDTERSLELHRAISRDPALFVQVLSWLYRRKDGAADPELEGIEPKRVEMLADIAYHALEGWDIVPGKAEDGTIDKTLFAEWNSKVLSMAEEASRLNPAYSMLAALYARFARRQGWEDWLPDPILELLDRPEHEGLRERFRTGVYNARGGTTRHPYEGGGQERDLANDYRALAERYGNSFPRVAELLKKIAKSYEWDAEREDERAAVGERWHP